MNSVAGVHPANSAPRLPHRSGALQGDGALRVCILHVVLELVLRVCILHTRARGADMICSGGPTDGHSTSVVWIASRAVTASDMAES